MALTKVTGQVINSTTDLSVGVATVGGGTSTGDLYVVGVTTFSGDVSVGGTLTYEDVTNVDSVGLITARSGISVTGVGVTIALGGLNVNAGIATFADNVLIGGPTHSRELSVHAATNTTICVEGASNGTSNLMFGDENDEDVGMIQYNHADNDLAFTVNTGEALAIKSDGQLVASGTGSELNITNTGSTATEDTAVLYTSVSGVHNRVLIKTSTNNGGDPYIKFDGGGQDMIVGTRYAGTTNNLLVLGPGNDPDTTSGIFVKGTGIVGVGTDNPASKIELSAASAPHITSILDAKTDHITMTTGQQGGGLNVTTGNHFAINHQPFADRGGNSNLTERLRIDSSGRLLLGTTTEGFATYGDQFTIANSGHCGMTIRSGDTSDGNIYFSDGTSGSAEVRGFVEYNHNGDTMKLGTNGAAKLTIGTSGDLTLTGAEGISANLYLLADQGDDNGDGWRIGSNQDSNDLTIANNASGSYTDFVTIDACPTQGTSVGIATASGAFCGTVDKAFKYTQPTPGEQNIPQNAWTTISTSYGWVLPSAGTYKLTSGNRVKLWVGSGYIQTRLYDNTASAAISNTLRMMFEQGNSTAPMGAYNVHINNVWVITIPTARTIYQQYNTTNSDTASTIQDDVNGRNYYMWERIG